MARVTIEGLPVLSFEVEPRQRYWGAMSKHAGEKFGYGEYTNATEVEAILLSCFDFLISEFKNILASEKHLGFYLHVFWLHEKSWELNLKILGGAELHTVSKKDFAIYRRILKLILEQGCDAELNWGPKFNLAEINRITDKLHDLIYVGTFLYEFADHIAFQKMIIECYKINFDEYGMLVIDWQYHYGFAYEKLFPSILKDYQKATFDQSAVTRLVKAIEDCFNISYDFATGQIFEVQKYHNPNNPDLQTIEPYVLPINLAHNYSISENEAKDFYRALTISSSNKLPIDKAIYNPYSMNRYLYKPILVYKVNGVERALVGKGKIQESIGVLGINAIHWNKIYPEWLSNQCMRKFITALGDQHDKILEDEIEKITKEKGLLYFRNIKAFKLLNGKSVRINNDTCGEIDFIIINPVIKTIFVCEVKYNQTRNEAVGYRNENSTFIKEYEPKLEKKHNWVKANLNVLAQHLQISFKIPNFDFTDYKIDAVFFINSPTFYMFNGNYKAITLNQIDSYLNGIYAYPTVIAKYKRLSGIEIYEEINHPYFRKP